MRVKLFRARRMAEAMDQLRAELGAEAIILSTRRVAEGIEVTAALEAAEEPILIPPVPAAPATTPMPAATPIGTPGPLGFHNLPPALATRLSAAPLEVALQKVLRFAPLPHGAPKPLLLAGPPGAGKTLTCAKLAARMVLAGAAPVVVTADGRRAGAAEQLAAFTRVLGLTLAVAPSPATAAKALARRMPGQPALLDAPGCDPFAPEEAVALRVLADATQAEIALVLPAGMDPAEAADLARAFAALGARWLVPTRLDLVRRLGGVLAAAHAAALALAEAGTGPGAADGLTPLSPALLAGRLRDCGPRRGAVAAEQAPPETSR